MLLHENVKLLDFWEHQKINVQWLMEHDVICPQYYGSELKNIIDEWCRNSDLRVGDSLFSEPEQEYLNYELNKSAYSNGRDLRNKYAHSTYPEDEKVQVMDYMILLKVMILVVTKINEEFCLREQLDVVDGK